MLFYAGKILQPFISPYHLALLALVIGWWLLKRGRTTGARRCVVLAILLLLVPGIPIISDFAMMPLERNYQIMQAESRPQADAIVVLGGTTVRTSYPRLDAEEMNGARLLQAVRLYKQKKAKYIIVSGGNPYKSSLGHIRHEADDMYEVLKAMGVPPEYIYREVESRNTDENAIETAKLLEAKNLRSILLVTSAFHLPRAVPLFEAQGVKVTPVPCSFTVTQGEQEFTQFIPSADALTRSTAAIKEVVGRVFYSLIGKT